MPYNQIKMTQQEKDLQIAREVKQNLAENLKDNLISVYFYGSRAKGKAREDSDLDLFVLVRKRPKFGSGEDNSIAETTIKYLNQKNIYVSTVVYDLKHYNKYRNLSYLREVNRGIKL